METYIKKAIKAGNSSAVILPRSWLHREVRIELLRKTPDTILSDVINIIKIHSNLEDIIGIYLVGSYARGEESGSSDIDVLVITNNTDKEMINDGIYNILVVSSKLLKQKLANDLFPLGPMIKEAKPLLNSNYLDLIEVKITPKNVKWYLDTTEAKLKIIKRIIDKIKRKYLSDRIAYTLVLRIRTLYLIKKLINNEGYSKKEFIGTIKRVSGGSNAYERYMGVKNNLKEKNGIGLEETKKLYGYLKNQLDEIKSLLNYRGP